MEGGVKRLSILPLFLIVTFLVISSPSAHSQIKKLKKDSSGLFQNKNFIKDSKIISVLRSEEHSPQKSTIYSALIPGWGQAYNKKYWKVPIVWAGIGAVGYFFYTSQNQYNTFKEYYTFLYNNPGLTIDSGNPLRPWTNSDLGTLLTNINSSRKNRDLSVIILFAVWGLNMIDANVDGHFFSFDVDEDLSMKLSPATWEISPNRKAYGLNLVLNLY